MNKYHYVKISNLLRGWEFTANKSYIVCALKNFSNYTDVILITFEIFSEIVQTKTAKEIKFE